MPSTEIRQSVLRQARHLVVKVGTQVITGSDGLLDVHAIEHLAEQIAKLRKRGMQVTLVSSGAVGAGMAELGLSKRPTDLAAQQAVAAVGQNRLMAIMHDAFAAHGVTIAQLLLTRDDFDARSRFLNIRNCIAQLQAMDCLPIANENDTVAVEELRFGDNDQLAALICNAVRADALVLLSSVPGLLDPQGQVIDLITDLSDAQQFARHGEQTRLGTGGMTSKLQAVSQVTRAGEVAVIALGRQADVLIKLIEGEKLGTVFMPARRKLSSKRRWIGLTKRPLGTIHVDAGAIRAVVQRGKSLLASGVTQVHGTFKRGDVVRVVSETGDPVARGLCNFSSEELAKIKGVRSSQIPRLLGRPSDEEVIHRDNLVAE